MKPLTRQQALSQGITPAQLRSDSHRRLFRGVVIDGEETVTLQTWVDAARLVLPADAQLTGLTALRFHGIWFQSPFPLHFATAQDRSCDQLGIRLTRRRALGSGSIASVEQAYADAARRLDPLECVQLAELVLSSRPELETEVMAATHRELRSLIRPQSESVRETQVRLMVVLAGLPEPELQVSVHDEQGIFLARADMLFREFGLALEYDGEQHDTPQQRAKDQARREALARAGIKTVVFNRARLWPPEEAVRVVHAELVARGYRGPEPFFGLAWRTMFKGRLG